MSTLDRAFIRVYERDRAATEHGTGPVPPAHVSHLRPSAPPDLPPAPPEPPAQLPKALAADILPIRASATPTVPAPHMSIKSQGATVPVAVATGTSESTSSPAIAFPSPSEDTPRVRPVFEVERLNWPSVVSELAGAASLEYGLLARDLAGGSRRGQKLVVVAASVAKCGATTVTLFLARLLSSRGLSVALVDGDFATAGVTQQLGLAPESGWDDVLTGAQPLDEALIESLDDRVTVLPWRQTDHRPRADGAAVASTLAVLKSAFDIVLVDLGAGCSRWANDTHAARLPVADIDLGLVVRDARQVSWDAAEQAATWLTSQGANRWCPVENFVR